MNNSVYLFMIVFLIIAIIALIIAIIVYANELNTCQTYEHPLCFQYTCPQSDPNDKGTLPCGLEAFRCSTTDGGQTAVQCSGGGTILTDCPNPNPPIIVETPTLQPN